jgi:hypothetical protein
MSDKKDFTARARQQLEDWDYQLDRLTARLNEGVMSGVKKPRKP